MTGLGYLGSCSDNVPNSVAYGINDAGQIVGVSSNYCSGGGAFLYEGGAMTDLNSFLPTSSGWELEAATAINDSGQIVGTGIINGQVHAFLLDTANSSSPEPSTLVRFAVRGGCASRADAKELHPR